MEAVLTAGRADAVLAASIFHFRKFTVAQAKHYLHEHGVPVRLETPMRSTHPGDPT